MKASANANDVFDAVAFHDRVAQMLEERTIRKLRQSALDEQIDMLVWNEVMANQCIVFKGHQNRGVLAYH
ncbi:hypothetical protein EV356DRAFT_505955 [Viridothelium virens]|uniref:Uncharacterized protein n=1 Tax=Viridothelium virens TaxID=1048519 RepID=A0A6A6HLB5_VIRVR|nr:hypothetical protein EV356DRAFT_505955 [Viridothelium virens]